MSISTTTDFHPTGLLDFEAKWIGTIDQTKIDNMVIMMKEYPKTRTALLRAMLAHVTLPQPITSESYLMVSQNYKNAWAVTFDNQNHEGLWIMADEGIWHVRSKKYLWAGAQHMDLACGVTYGRRLMLVSTACK